MILVFGKTGQVARELSILPDIQCLGREEADLEDADHCVNLIRHHSPIAVINAAAYTAVDKAESESALAHRINAHAPAAMAEACADLSIPMVQISTDYVFDGSGTLPWQPSDQPAPLGVYGRSKLEGEKAVRRSAAAHVILRTSWVVSAHGNNFLKTMLRLGAEREDLSIVADQIGGPTGAREIASACRNIAIRLCTNPEKSGDYHFAGAPDTSWADFAREIFRQARLECEVNDIPSTDYLTPAVRPLNSRLDCSKTEEVFGIARPDWRDTLNHILRDLGAIE